MQAKTSTLSEHKAALFGLLLRKNIPLAAGYSVLLLIMNLLFFFRSIYMLESWSILSLNLFVMLQYVLLIFAPFLSAIYNFRFLTSRQASDSAFSLPVSRGNLFFSHYFAGLLSYLVPYAVFKNPFLSFLLVKYADQESSIQIDQLNAELVSAGISVLLFAACFSIAVFLCVNLGKISDACLYYGLLSVFAPVAFTQIMLSLDASLFGVESTAGYGGSYVCFTLPQMVVSVIARVLGIKYASYYDITGVLSGSQITFLLPGLVYPVLAAGFTAVSYLLFRKRPCEKADAPFAFGYFKPVLAVLLSFVIGIVFSLGLSSRIISREQLVISAVPFLIISAVVYLGASAVAARSFKIINRTTPFYGITVVLYLVIFSYFATGGFGQITYVPDAQQVSMVTINLDQSRVVDHSANRNELSLLDLTGISDSVRNPQEVTFTDPEKIGTVTRFHTEILEYYEKFDYDYAKANQQSGGVNYSYAMHSAYSPGITYTLKNGKTIARRYVNIDNSLMQGAYQEISSQSDAAEKDRYTVDQVRQWLDQYDFSGLVVTGGDIFPPFMLNYAWENTGISSEEMKELILAIFTDEQDFDAGEDYTGKPYMTICITGQTAAVAEIIPSHLSLTINENYHRTIKCLESMGIYKKGDVLRRDNDLKIEIFENVPDNMTTSSVKIIPYDGKQYFISDLAQEDYDSGLNYYQVNTVSVFKDPEAAEAIFEDLRIKYEYTGGGMIVRFRNDYNMYSNYYYIPEGSDGYYGLMRLLQR